VTINILSLFIKHSEAHYWIGLTDLQEGKWRWSYDQSDATYKKWYSGLLLVHCELYIYVCVCILKFLDGQRTTSVV
jgi:hypothetical protein